MLHGRSLLDINASSHSAVEQKPRRLSQTVRVRATKMEIEGTSTRTRKARGRVGHVCNWFLLRTGMSLKSTFFCRRKVYLQKFYTRIPSSAGNSRSYCGWVTYETGDGRDRPHLRMLFFIFVYLSIQK